MQNDPYLRWLISLELSITQSHNLLEHFGSAKALFAYASRNDSRIDKSVTSKANKTALEAANTAGDYEFISFDSPSYPSRLKQINHAPLGLFMLGKLPQDMEKRPTVAIIGSRNNSLYGKQVTSRLAGDLAKCGIIIISGMARGLDAYAHEAAIKAGGDTIAVLPSGIDICYPAENAGLYKQIPKQGALISEFMPNFRPQKWSYPARNRIISGLSDLLIIVEAGIKSGTFTTVTHALNQGREVMAVPGSVLNTQSIGTNQLLKEGAAAITTYTDALSYLQTLKHLKDFFAAAKPENLSPAADTLSSSKKLPLASCESLVYSCINYEAVSIEYIVQHCKLDISTVNKTLLELELAGRIKRLVGNKFIRN